MLFRQHSLKRQDGLKHGQAIQKNSLDLVKVNLPFVRQRIRLLIRQLSHLFYDRLYEMLLNTYFYEEITVAQQRVALSEG